MTKLTSDDFNNLCKFFAMLEINDKAAWNIIAKFGFRNTGELVHYLENFKK